MPATSKKQFRFMQAVAHGMKPKGGGPSKSQAAEYVKGQSPKGLPEKAPDSVDSYDRTGKYAKKGKPGYGK